MSEPTLLEDLEAAAARTDCMFGNDSECAKDGCTDGVLAARLRAHAARVREEMARAPLGHAARASWHEFVHEFTREHWPCSHPDDYDPTDEQLIEMCAAAARAALTRINGGAR